MKLPGVPIAVLQALKGVALGAGMPRLALVGGVVRDQLLAGAGELHHTLQDGHRPIAEHSLDHLPISTTKAFAGSRQ